MSTAVAMVPSEDFLSALLAPLISRLHSHAESRFAIRVQQACARMFQVTCVELMAAENAADVEFFVAELVDRQEYSTELSEFSGVILSGAALFQQSTPDFAEMADTLFGTPRESASRIARLEQCRLSALAAYLLSAGDPSSERPSQAGQTPTTVIEALTSAGNSGRTARAVFDVAKGNAALIAALLLFTERKPTPAFVLEALLNIWERGTYAHLRILSAFVPTEVPLSIVPSPDRFDKPTEDARAYDREQALASAVARMKASGRPEQVYPDEGDADRQSPD